MTKFTKLGAGVLAGAVALLLATPAAANAATLGGDGQYALPTLTAGHVYVTGDALLVGETLTAVTYDTDGAAWSDGDSGLGLTYTYTWSTAENGVTFASTTSPSVTLPTTAYLKTIDLTVVATEPGFTPTSVSATIGYVSGLNTIKVGTVKISGTAKVGKKLSAKLSGWTSGVTYHYGWYSGSKKISSSSTYKISKKYKGKKLTVKVYATKTGYSQSATKTSSATKAVKK